MVHTLHIVVHMIASLLSRVVTTVCIGFMVVVLGVIGVIVVMVVFVVVVVVADVTTDGRNKPEKGKTQTQSAATFSILSLPLLALFCVVAGASII